MYFNKNDSRYRSLAWRVKKGVGEEFSDEQIADAIGAFLLHEKGGLPKSGSVQSKQWAAWIIEGLEDAAIEARRRLEGAEYDSL